MDNDEDVKGGSAASGSGERGSVSVDFDALRKLAMRQSPAERRACDGADAFYVVEVGTDDVVARVPIDDRGKDAARFIAALSRPVVLALLDEIARQRAATVIPEDVRHMLDAEWTKRADRLWADGNTEHAYLFIRDLYTNVVKAISGVPVNDHG